jgi:hypothetical protein
MATLIPSLQKPFTRIQCFVSFRTWVQRRPVDRRVSSELVSADVERMGIALSDLQAASRSVERRRRDL